jgi:hypothetical protein
MPAKAWRIISARPRLLPLPTPVEGSDTDILKYMSYDELKNTFTRPVHRPSFSPSTVPKSEALNFDRQLGKEIPTELKNASSNRV